MKQTVIAYDLGTGGLKTSVVGADGTLLHSLFIPYKTHYLPGNLQEQAPEDWWRAVVNSTRALWKENLIRPEEVVALAISGHSLGVIPIGKKGELLREKTPIWSDQRAVREADLFFKNIRYEDWYQKTGNGFPAACYSLFKLMWYKTHEPQLYKQIDKVIGTKDYCNYRFTGKLVTDYSYASGSGVFDLHRWEYCEEYITAAGIERDLFPEILASDEVLGTLTPEAAAETGLPAGVKVICGGVDNSCMALGAKGITSGRIYTSLGSSAWIALIADRPVLDITFKPYVFAHVIKGMYTSATCIFSAGSSYQWIRNILCRDLMQQEEAGGLSAYEKMEELAGESVPGASGLLFNPSLAGGSAIEPSPDINGAFTGLRLHHTRNDLIRATMEGIALNLRVALDLIRMHYPEPEKMLMVGGGSKSALWMQLFADIYGMQVETTRIGQEAATLGAAALALKGTGLQPDHQWIDDQHVTRQIFIPDRQARTFYREDLYPRFKRLTELLSHL